MHIKGSRSSGCRFSRSTISTPLTLLKISRLYSKKRISCCTQRPIVTMIFPSWLAPHNSGIHTHRVGVSFQRMGLKESLLRSLAGQVGPCCDATRLGAPSWNLGRPAALLAHGNDVITERGRRAGLAPEPKGAGEQFPASKVESPGFEARTRGGRAGQKSQGKEPGAKEPPQSKDRVRCPSGAAAYPGFTGVPWGEDSGPRTNRSSYSVLRWVLAGFPNFLRGAPVP